MEIYLPTFNDIAFRMVTSGHAWSFLNSDITHIHEGGGPRVVVSAAFHARVRGSVPGLGGSKETKKCFFSIHVWKSVLWGASVTER